MSQRTHFRFDAFQVNPVGVRVSFSERAPLLGEPLFIHPEGLQARFSDQQSLGIALGDKLELEFSSRDWRKPIVVLGRLHSRHEQKSIRDLGFTFLKHKEVEEMLLPHLRALMNRRGATRASPDPKHPVDVYLDDAGSGRSICGQLVELSGTGLLMQAPLGSETGFVDAKDCRASFHLPGHDTYGLSVVVHIRERRLCSSSIQLGLEFDALRTATFASQLDKILEFVMLRQPRSAHRLRAG